ncbi:hypothetical protein [Chitinimonas naiadis]
MNAKLNCTVIADVARQAAAISHDQMLESAVERRLEDMRGDGAALFDAMGNMNDVTLKALCNLVALSVSTAPQDDRLAALDDLTKLLNTEYRPSAVRAVLQEEADEADQQADYRAYERAVH